MRAMKSIICGMIILLLIMALGATEAEATPEHSLRTSQGCGICHMEPMGSALNERGLEYAASGYKWPPSGGFKVLGPIKKQVRFLVGMAHIIASFLWFGTILYVHLLLKPAYAEKGLPRGEVALGFISMAVVGASGALLTLSRVSGLEVLYDSPWGRTLSLKIALYLLMLGSVFFVVLYLGPRLRRVAGQATIPPDSAFDPETLAQFDGKDGRPAYIAYEGKVLDVSGLRLWKGGLHMKHQAGADMTSFLPKAPHGVEKIAELKSIGTYDASRKPKKSVHQRMFYIVAYMNLVIVFLVLAVIAYWRWGL